MRYIFLFFIITLLSSCDDASIEIDRKGAPALWQVNSDGVNSNSLYLFGTVHLLPEGADWSTPALENAMDASDILVIETLGLEDTANVSKIYMQMAQDEKTPPIVSRLSGADKIALERVMDEQNLSQKQLSNLETWAATLAIAGSLTDELGLKRALGVETILAQRFKGKQTQGLETIPSQFAIFDDLTELQQRDMLRTVVNDADESEAAFLQLLNAWLDGDIDNMLSDSGMMTLPALRKALLDDRNEKWAIALDEKLQKSENKRYFVGVGAAHLIGEKGVPALLKAAGYTVERIQ